MRVDMIASLLFARVVTCWCLGGFLLLCLVVWSRSVPSFGFTGFFCRGRLVLSAAQQVLSCQLCGISVVCAFYNVSRSSCYFLLVCLLVRLPG